MTPAIPNPQPDLPCGGLPSVLDTVWEQHRRRLPGMSRDQALADPFHGPLIRMHVKLLERRQRRGPRR